MRGRFRLAVVMACVMALHATARAQTGVRLQGTAEDETGAPIPVVRVTLLSTKSNTGRFSR